MVNPFTSTPRKVEEPSFEKLDLDSFFNDSMTISKHFDKLNYEQLKIQYSNKKQFEEKPKNDFPKKQL